ncbi:hypothetical protein DCCM_3072 [Desulfocucumis palustris]|uniref:Uncharacterized protein n=1 Tax=Desulfocucumis palustris TaxID=1898651 RepID=A0A2L2XJ60_9FIRM|nr:hypothetical protein [Desulfocucumis palustris]GBF33961.1 hypothetical protein DCCM_3072 [Desulfocucumis palustris]
MEYILSGISDTMLFFLSLGAVLLFAVMMIITRVLQYTHLIIILAIGLVIGWKMGFVSMDTVEAIKSYF